MADLPIPMKNFRNIKEGSVKKCSACKWLRTREEYNPNSGQRSDRHTCIETFGWQKQVRFPDNAVCDWFVPMSEILYTGYIAIVYKDRVCCIIQELNSPLSDEEITIKEGGFLGFTIEDCREGAYIEITEEGVRLKRNCTSHGRGNSPS